MLPGHPYTLSSCELHYIAIVGPDSIPPPVNSSFFDTSSLVVGAASGDRSAIVEISAPSSRAATRGSSAGTASPSGSTSPPTVRLHPALPLQPAPQPALAALPLPPQGRRDLPPHRQHHHRLQPRHRRSHKFNLRQVLSEGMGKTWNLV